MSLLWDELAEREFVEAAGYYASVDPDLGDRFVSEVEASIAKLRLSFALPEI